MTAKTSATTAIAVVLGTLALWQTSARGQQAPARPAGAAAAVPRTADGHPDLQGTYDVATMTQVERAPAFNGRLSIPLDEAHRIEAAAAARTARANGQDSGSRSAPPIGGDGSTGAAGGVGGYNAFWIDSGDAFTVIDGQARTSIVVDPSNGRIRRSRLRHARGRRPREASRHRISRRAAATSGWKQGPVPTTIPSGARSANGACSDSVPRRDHPRCPCSTTTSTRSCRRKTPS